MKPHHPDQYLSDWAIENMPEWWKVLTFSLTESEASVLIANIGLHLERLLPELRELEILSATPEGLAERTPRQQSVRQKGEQANGKRTKPDHSRNST